MGNDPMCRTCRTVRGLMNIFDEENKELITMLGRVAYIFIKEDDLLPKKICHSCANSLKMAFEFVVQCQKTDKILRENPQKPFVDSYEENVSVKSETIDEGMSRQEALRKTPDDSNDDKVSVKVEPIEQIIVESVSDQASTNIFVIEDYPGDDGIKEEFIDDTEFDENDIIEVDEDFVDETSDIVFSIHVDEYNKEVTSQDTILTLEPDIVQSVAISSTYITSNRVPATSKVKTKKQPRTKENKTYICPVCSATFADHSEFIMHKKTHYPYRSACKICGKQFIKSSGLQTHMDVHNGIKFSCHLCDKQCSTRANLTRHIRQCHDKIRPYSCKVCGRQFSQRTTLDGHAATHTEERNFACDMCGKTYKSVFVLNAHKRTHHPNFVRTKKVKYDKRNKYVCEQCGKVSNSLVYHKLHTKLHSDVKKFECEVCHKQFHLKVWLNVHMRIHTDERPYICEICGKAFRQVNHLKYHKRVIHEPEAARQFACKFCGKSFTSAGTLRVHERIHTGEKPYKCDDCLACFIDINGLKRHRAKVHSMESSKHNSIMIEEYIVCNEDTPEIDGNKE